MNNLDRYIGCMVGGAVGDALGYPVEFLHDDEIHRRYGPRGIRNFDPEYGGQISDDTQMTLFTANCLLFTITRGITRGIGGPPQMYMGHFLEDWLGTQGIDTGSKNHPAWVRNIPEMNHRRAPGVTCIRYSPRDMNGSIEEPCNDSKGCGGVMRVAPVGLYLRPGNVSRDEIDMIGAEMAALTHGHPLGYIPAAMLVHIINMIVHDRPASLGQCVSDARSAMFRLFGHTEHTEYLDSLVGKAMTMARTKDMDDSQAIREFGEGWVAEEALAIALYCSLRHEDSFEDAVVAAVNHNGDSDSTGAITGNIMGALLGSSGIPERFFRNVELRDTLVEIACDMYRFEPKSDCYLDQIWSAKYVFATYPKSLTEH